jgi:acyl-CoA synthetase (AMP-forming)/AMP-acid ligase II
VWVLVDARFGRLIDPLAERVWEPGEVLTRCDSRMRRFADLGVERGARVFLHYGNRPEFFADLLAIWRLGACAIPIDGRLTAFEVETLAKAAQPRLSVWDETPDPQLTSALAGLGTGIISLEHEQPASGMDRPPRRAGSRSTTTR